MLTGTFKYYGKSYDVNAYDFGDNVVAYLYPKTTEDKLFIDAGVRVLDEDGSVEEIIPPTWTGLYVSVGLGQLAVERDVVGRGKSRATSELNVDLLVTYGSIVRGMKMSCTKNNRVGDEGLYQDSYIPQQIITYDVHGNKIVAKMSTILELSYISEDSQVSLLLSDDGSYTAKIDKTRSTLVRYKLDLAEFVTDLGTDDGWDFGGNDTIFNLQQVIARNPNKSYAWLRGRKYKIVTDLDEVERIMQTIWQHDGIVSFDTETTGLKVNITSRQGIGDRLVGMIFSIKPGEAWYFPIAHKYIKNICTPANESYIITKYFKPILETKDILCHNGSYDWKVMYNYGICVNLKHDTYILFKVTLWNDHRSMELNLKDLTKSFLGRDSFKLSDFTSGKFGENVKFWDFDEMSTLYYACPDTDNLIELYQYAVENQLLEKYGANKIYEIEVAFSVVIAYQEYYGHCVDITRIDDLVAKIKKTKEDTYKTMVDMVGHDFNPRSPKDLQRTIVTELGYPVLEKTDSGAPCFDKNVRKKMMDERDLDGNPKYPFINYLNDYLNVAQLESNFTKNLETMATEDGFIFSSVNQFLETGRVSVKDPNYQSYNDTVKQYIIPRANCYMLDADYSSVEARIMVSMAGCKNMVEFMRDPDTDYHTLKASQMFGIPYELVTHKQRKMAKGVNFGILYGLGDPNLGVNLFGARTPENTRKAKRQKDLYFTGMEELRGFIERSKAQGTTQFYSTTFFGRRRYYDPRRVRKDKIERQSCNARIQGTAADIYKCAMIRLFHTIRKNDWLGKVLISAFVHDECVLEVSNSIDPIVMLGILRKCMMLEIKGWCPLFIGAGFGTNWYEAKNIEIPIQVQESLVAQYGETGLDWWDGSSVRLRDWIIDQINNYGRDRVISYLKDENNKGKVLAPAVNAIAHNVVDAIRDGQVIEGCVNTDLIATQDVLDNLKEFCKAFDCMGLYESAGVIKAEHKDIQQQDSDADLGRENVPQDEVDDLSPVEAMAIRLNRTGVVFDPPTKSIYVRYVNSQQMLNKVLELAQRSSGNYTFYVQKGMEQFKLDNTVNANLYASLLSMYMQFKQIHNGWGD